MKNKRIMNLILLLINIAIIQTINLNHKNVKLSFLAKILRLKVGISLTKLIFNKILLIMIHCKIILLNQRFFVNHKHRKIK